MSIAKIIHKKSDELFEEVKSIRRHLHQNPELSFEEHETSAFLKNKLNSWGIPIDTSWVGTGFSVLLDSGNPGPFLGLRADLDALPILEQNTVSYASKMDGKMHACGHDVHAACLMGVAKILSETKDSWNGKVVLLFQAGEEKLPGGASLTLKEGFLKKYPVDFFFAQHVYPELPAGQIGFRPGMYMASADEIYINVIGKGGHAAMPHACIDPIVISAQLLLALQQIRSRELPPTLPMVLSFGKILGIGATNVIPEKVSLEGTLRVMDEKWRAKIHERIESICQEVTAGLGARVECTISKGYPFLVNDESLTTNAQLAAKEYLGEEAVQDLPLRMTAEDFAYFSQETKTCFYRLGVRNEDKGIVHGVHHPKFNVEEDALKVGVGALAYLCINTSLNPPR